MRSTWLLLAALTTGCFGSTADDTGDTDDTDDGQLDDPTAGLGIDQDCADFEVDDQPTAGWTSYFVGDFELDGDEVSGWEYWLLFPDDEGRQTSDWSSYEEGEGCRIAWEMFGSKGEPVSCGSCDFSITFDAYADAGASDCPQGLFDSEGQDFTVTYDVRIDGDGAVQDSIVYFESGDELGRGQANDSALTYATDPECRFF